MEHCLSEGAIKESLTACACVSSPIIKNVSVVVLENVHTLWCTVGSNLVIENCLIRNKLVLRNHFPWPIVNLLHKEKEHLALRNNFKVTKKFIIPKYLQTKQANQFRCRFLKKFIFITNNIVLGSYGDKSITANQSQTKAINYSNNCQV